MEASRNQELHTLASLHNVIMVNFGVLFSCVELPNAYRFGCAFCLPLCGSDAPGGASLRIIWVVRTSLNGSPSSGVRVQELPMTHIF